MTTLGLGSTIVESEGQIADDLAGQGLRSAGGKLNVQITGTPQAPVTGLEIAPNNSVRISAAAAGAGLSGGGGDALEVNAGAGLAIVADAVAVGAGDGIAVAADAVSVAPADFTGAGLEVSGGDIRIAAAAAGAGLTGGAGAALAVGAGAGISVAADSVAVDGATLAGAGLTAAGAVLAVGAGAGISVNADDVALKSQFSAFEFESPRAADTVATTAMGESPLYLNKARGVSITLTAIWLTISNTLAGDNTNTFTIIIRRVSDNATIVSFQNNVANGGMVALTPKSLGALANAVIADGVLVSAEVTKQGTGQTIGRWVLTLVGTVAT